ncbi:MAG: DEAD/DEAH box helicase [Lachnospiraceae bacterium]|nr:DEAD/DEAH box helicase [Lachnospiraceae bacterium]
MDDLIFVFNAKESRKNGIIIIETYLCNNKFNKKKKYIGGIVKKINILDRLEVDNFTREEFNNIQNEFCKVAYNVSSFQYIIKTFEFCNLLLHYGNKNIFYFQTYKQDMHLICNYTMMEKYQEKKNDILCNILGHNIWYVSKKSELYLISNGTEEKKILDVVPVAKVIIYDDEFKLVFEYAGVEVDYSSSATLFEYGEEIIARQYSLEREQENKLVSLGFKKKKGNIYITTLEVDVEDILVEKGFNIEHFYAERQKNNQLSIEINQSGNDWFDLKVYYKYNNETIELGKRIDLFAKKTSVMVGTDRINIPFSIIENAEKIIKDEEGLKIPKKNIWTLLRIAEENNIDVNHFLTYNTVEIKFDNLIEGRLFDYQRTGVRWLKWLYINKIGGCLADDMGVGKTIQTIAFLCENEIQKQIKHVLIIVPYVLLTNWVREFEKFSNENKIVIYHGGAREELLYTDNIIFITTYATAASDIAILSEFLYDVVIFDEIQYIKNNSSKTYNALSKINARCRIGLSGTPFENRIDELWNVLSILNPDMLIGKKNFIKRYVNDNSMELHKLLAPFILRRTKEEVLDELPEKTEEIIFCDFSEKQKKLYDAIKIAVKNSMCNYSIVNNATILKGLLLLRQVCCHPLLLPKEVNVENIHESCKFEVMKIKVSEIIANRNKVVIFSQFTSMLNLIKEWCEMEKYKYFYIDGQTTRRQKEIDAFEKANEGVFLISLKAGGVGLNLTSAHYAIIFEPWWNPFAEQQAEDRIFRIGQKQDVIIYKMIVTNSIEEKILNLQNSKKELFESVMNGIPYERLNMQELIELL